MRDQAGLADRLVGSVRDILEQPEPTNLAQTNELVVGRLNEWLELGHPRADWHMEPLINTLPAPWPERLTEALLGQQRFVIQDGQLLQETVLMNQAAQAACGEEVDDLEAAAALFDWVVRNIQMPKNESLGRMTLDDLLPQFPNETLRFGQGRAIDRAWVFVQMARQQGLEAVVLSLPNGERGGHRAAWLVAVLIPSPEGQPASLYLFEPMLGLPIPGPAGQGIATLKQLRADPGLLRQLDLDAEHPYPVDAEQLDQIVAWVECDPAQLSWRMRALEKHMGGRNRVVLSVDPSRVAEDVLATGQVEEVALWPDPFEAVIRRTPTDPVQQERQSAIMRQHLKPYMVGVVPDELSQIPMAVMRGRLQHLRGQYLGDPGANAMYQMARLADADLERLNLTEAQREILVLDKQNASYWLALIAYERAMYPLAEHGLKTATIEASPDGPWSESARFNLARVYEALDRPDEAIALYEAETTSSQRHGNLLRARWLREAAQADDPGDPPQPPSDSKEQAPAPDDSDTDTPEPDKSEPDSPAPESTVPEPTAPESPKSEQSTPDQPTADNPEAG
jgi:tetratricopeptide (TPR) repeat protein